jgi:hypothetical protein
VREEAAQKRRCHASSAARRCAMIART